VLHLLDQHGTDLVCLPVEQTAPGVEIGAQPGQGLLTPHYALLCGRPVALIALAAAGQGSGAAL
jgi:hypothetical protein